MTGHPKVRRAALRASVSSAILLLAQPALAQDADTGAQAAENTDEVIVVTGSLIRQKAISSPVSVVSGADIEARALTNAAELVQTLPGNVGSEAGTNQLSQPLTTGTAQFNLRNLGLGSTLVLVNGRRHTLAAVANNDGSTFVDINTLVPLIAVERLDVVKDGAGATYGSDAVAGVVNFITRKRVERPMLQARVSVMDGAEQVNLAGIAGVDVGDAGHLVIAASYYRSSRLESDRRAFSTAATFGRPSWHAVSSYGQPGSYFVPSLGRYRPDPDCGNTAFPESYQLSPTDLCRFDFSAYYDLIPKERRIQVFGTYNGTIGEDLKLNLEAGYANTRDVNASSPSYPILAVTPVVPANHPDNPFGEAVFFRGRLLNGSYGPTLSRYYYEAFRLAGSLEGKFSDAWSWSVNTSYSQQNSLYDKPDTIKTRLVNALRGLGGPNCDPFTGTPGVGNCQYYNPFGSAALGTGTANSDTLIRSLIGYTNSHGRSSLTTLDGLASGDLFALGDEMVQAAFGAQVRRSTLGHDNSDLMEQGELITIGQEPDFYGKQETYAAFGEIRVPLAKLAQVTASGRYEKYRSGFGRFTPKLSLLANPFSMLSLRASWGQAFRAPSIYQLAAVQAAQPGVNDPRFGTFVFVNTRTFGNSNLKPERSTNWNLGATFRPVRAIELNVDYFSFRYRDLIVKENPQPFVTEANLDDLAGRTGTAAQQRVLRNPQGNLQEVTLNFVNASSVEVEGLDVGAKARLSMGAASVELRADWSHFTKYDLRLSTTAPVTDGLGSVNFNNFAGSMPQDRLEYGAYLEIGAHKFNALGHYVSGYDNDRAGITSKRIGSQHTWDVQYSLDLDRALGIDGATLTAGAINVTDKNPPLAQLYLGFDPQIHDPRGRVVYVGLNKSF